VFVIIPFNVSLGGCVWTLGGCEWTGIEEINEIETFINCGNHTSRGKMGI
jgi:hypothetical protein